MGSFNIQCSITNLVINENDEIVRVYMLPYETDKELRDSYIKHSSPEDYLSTDPISKGMYCFYEPFQLYVPFSLPIYGTYADYDLQSIKSSTTDYMLESFFGIGIDIIERIALDSRTKIPSEAKNTDILRLLTKTDILKSVWDKLTVNKSLYTLDWPTLDKKLSYMEILDLNKFNNRSSQKNRDLTHFLYILFNKQYLIDLDIQESSCIGGMNIENLGLWSGIETSFDNKYRSIWKLNFSEFPESEYIDGITELMALKEGLYKCYSHLRPNQGGMQSNNNDFIRSLYEIPA